jgi:hypothetical protein
MIDPDDRNIPEQSEGLGQGNTHREATGQARTASHGDTSHTVSKAFAFLRLVQQNEKVGKVLANGNVGHDATILHMRRYLTVHPLADNSSLGRKEG